MNKKILLIGLVFLLMLSSAFAVGTAPDPADTIAYYTLDDVDLTGSNPDDTTGNGWDGTTSGATTGVSGILNEAFTFDGTNDYVDLGTSLIVSTDTTFSVSGWFQLDNGALTSNAVFGMGTSATTNNFCDFRLNNGVAGTNFFGCGSATGGFDSITWTGADYNGVGWKFLVITVDASNMYAYIDGVQVGTVATSNFGGMFANSKFFMGQSFYNNAPTRQFGGQIDEFMVHDTALTTDEITYLYQTGTPGTAQQWDFTGGAVATAEVFPQVIESEQSLAVEINSNTYQDIFSTVFEPLNTTTAYSTWVVQMEAINKNTVGTCRAVINGTDYNTEINQSLLIGDMDIIYLFSDEFNVTQNQSYVATLQCKRDATNGARVEITEAEGQINLLATTTGTPINTEFGTLNLELNSSTFTQVFESNFTTSNYTGTDLVITLVTDGEAKYIHDSTSTIEIYGEVDGVAGPISQHYGIAGTEGTAPGLYLIKNVTANSNATIKIYAKSSSSDGNISVRFTLAEIFTHAQEANINDLTNTAVATGTWATIDTLYINNSGHTTSDIVVKTAFNAISLSGSQQLNYRIKSGTDFSQEYTIELNTAGVSNGVEHHLFPNPGNVNTSIEFQAYTSTASANITAGSIMAYIVDEVNAIPQFYTVQARNEWDNASITAFNVTLAIGTNYQSNATGYVNIFHVNGLDNFTVSAADYFNQSILNHNTTTNLTVDMLQSDITFNTTEIITNNTVAGNITINGVIKNTTESFYLATGTYNATFSGTNYFDKTVSFNVSPLDNVTINISGLSGTALNVTFRDFLTNTTQTGITGFFSNNELNLNESFNTGVEFYTVLSLLQGYDYNVTVVDDDFAITTTTYFVNASLVNETFYLYVSNSVNIYIRDEITRELINDTTFALEFVGDTTAFNASTSNGTYYVDLVTPDAYQLRYYSTSNTNYQLRAYTFELINQSFNEINLYAIQSNSSLVTVTFNIFSTALEPVEGARVILERYYIGDDGFSQVSSGSTNVDGVYIDFVEAVNAFYRYKVIYDGEIKYESPSRGTQFSADTNLNIYIELFADTYEEYEEIFNIPTTITYTNLTNYTGYFDFSYTNPNLYQLCFEVYINNSNTTETCPTVSASGSVQIPVSVTVDSRSVAIASAKAYSSNVASYVVYKTEPKSFSPSSAFTQDYNNLFNFGLSIILTIVALVFIRFPVVNVFLQTFVLVLFALIPLPFYTISIVTIGWIVAFNLVILWIVKKDGVPQ